MECFIFDFMENLVTFLDDSCIMKKVRWYDELCHLW